ncbi:MAG: Stp1/IreP family PP2C-type Ser/Thr phosphatase [Coriobacteriia bacterium]|nr:Stp1/IreP family PP2C-type Ser/Thr phosphatase [Coriobacteriia bacterium]
MSAAELQGAAGLTDPGLTRPSNEDSLLVEGPLYAVADGMGGHRAGEVASRIALDALLANAPRLIDAKALARAVRAANRAVIDSAEKSRTRTGMGTTLTAAMVDGTAIAVAHVGDSRAYLLHRGQLQRITEDHSMVADLVRQGSITEEDARFHPQRSVITRALGSDPNMIADVYELDASPGDRLLLCTDGLTGMLDDGYIAEILLAERDPNAAVAKLIEAANRAGGYDNITAVLIDIDDTPAGELTPARGSREAGRRVASRLLWLTAAAALIIVTSWGAYAFAQSRGYLIDEGGYVTVYRGLPGSFAGLSLHWRVEATDVPVDRLDLPVQTRLKDGIAFEDVADARARVAELRGSLSPTGTLVAPPPEATTAPAP